MAPFYGWVQLPQGKSHEEEFIFTTKLPVIPGTQFIDLGRMNG